MLQREGKKKLGDVRDGGGGGSSHVVVINLRICKLLLQRAVETEPGLVGEGMCSGGVGRRGRGV